MKVYAVKSDLIGEKVIVKSNGDEPFCVGTLICFVEEIKSCIVPTVKMDKDNRIYNCFGVVIPCHAIIESALNTMGYKEQWEYLRNLSLTIQLLRKG